MKIELNLKKDVRKRLARYLSDFFVPPTFLILSFITITYQFETSTTNILISLVNALLFGVIIPILFFIYFLKKHIIKSRDANIKTERIIPYLISVILCFIGLIISESIQLNYYIIILWLIYLISSIALYVINLKWKISAHSMGAAIPLVILIYLFGVEMLLFIVVVAAVGWSRVELGVHSKSQVMAGAFLGVIISFFYLLIFPGI